MEFETGWRCSWLETSLLTPHPNPHSSNTKIQMPERIAKTPNGSEHLGGTVRYANKKVPPLYRISLQFFYQDSNNKRLIFGLNQVGWLLVLFFSVHSKSSWLIHIHIWAMSRDAMVKWRHTWVHLKTRWHLRIQARLFYCSLIFCWCIYEHGILNFISL